MCGIAGYRGNLDKSSLKKMLVATGHRGPDDTGDYILNDVGLGQNRLSIIDLTRAGHQPMESKDGKVVIVFNGEIYNYKKIKDDLVNKKYSFISNILHNDWNK